ncbi:hypothetical protein LRP88_12481 [Fusarium phalaenopsidis]
MAQSTAATAYRAGHNGAPDNHADFLARVAQRESRSRGTRRPAPLSAEAHEENRKQLRRVTFVKPVYARETRINVAGLFRKWERYCQEKKVGDWKATLEDLQRETTMDFLLFVCGNYKVNSWGTLDVYIRQFQQLYTTVTGRFMDRNDSKEVYKEALTETLGQYNRHFLIPQFGLRAPNIDAKPVVSAAELEVLLVFNMAYDESIFPSERHRIQLPCCYKIMCYTGARPGELVDNERRKPKDGSIQKLFGSKVVSSPNANCEADEDEDNDVAPDEVSRRLDELLSAEPKRRGRPKALCYEDIHLMIVRHPRTGRAVPAMAIKFIHHKGADNRPKPTIFYFTPTRKLVFCVISDIIALALHDDAFAAESLTNASRVLGTKIPACKPSTQLRWKESMLKVPVFRRFGRNGELSEDEAMLYAKLRDDMGQQSENAGFEVRWTPKVCRRGASNAANGNAPDAVRDQMMRHDPKFLTFHDAYLNQMVEFDLQNTFLEEQTESELYKLFAHVSLTRDPRAKRDMVPAEVWANLPPDPEIVELEQRRALLKQGRRRIQGLEAEEEICMLTEQIRLKKGRRVHLITREYRQYYFYHRPTWDIERQARGEDEDEYLEPVIDVTVPEREKLAEILCHQPDDLTEDQIAQRRIDSIDLMVALCGKRETVRRSHARQSAKACLSIKTEPPEIEHERLPSPDRFPLLLHAAQCPDCIGDERLSREERTFTYCRPTVMNDHFDDQHLIRREQAERSGEKIRCEHPKCRDVKFQHVDHFRRHVQEVHGVTLRTSEQVRQRRQRKVSRRQMVRKQCKLVQ